MSLSHPLPPNYFVGKQYCDKIIKKSVVLKEKKNGFKSLAQERLVLIISIN